MLTLMDDYTKRSLAIAVRGVFALVVEQLLIAFSVFVFSGWRLDKFADPTIILALLALIYGSLCMALAREKVWAAIVLLTLIPLHTLPYLGILLVTAVMDSDLFPLPWPWSGAVTLAIITPMITTIVLVGRFVASFRRTQIREAAGFQVVFPIDGDQEANIQEVSNPSA